MGYFEERTVIPSVLRLPDLEQALQAKSTPILLSNIHIGNLQAFAAKCREAKKDVFVHVDMVGGFRPDRDGIRLLKNMFGVRGIFSNSAPILSTAKKSGLVTVQRLMLMDSRSLERCQHITQDTHPDAIELMPGAIAIRKVDTIREFSADVPLLAGGMIDTEDEKNALFDAGFTAVTTSTCALW